MIKQVFLLLAVLAAAQGLIDDWTGGLRVRFDTDLSGFMSQPRTIAEAMTARWIQVERPDGPLKSLIMYCPQDYIFCVLFDDTERIAGLQVALPQDKFTDDVFDWEIQGYTSWTPAGSDTSFWTLQQYFVDEEILALSRAERLAAHDRGVTAPHGKVWVTGVNKELYEISTNEDDMENTIYTEQTCVPLMGSHYYYNMSVDTECTNTGFFPWFPLYASGDLVGIGFLAAGKLPESSLETDYFERFGSAAVEMTVPDGPQCLYDLADSPGLLTIHIYYVNNPFLITCTVQ